MDSTPAIYSDYTTVDAETVNKVLSAPPFISVEGVINFRDFGALPVSSSESSRLQIKPLTLFRSGELTKLSENGKAEIKRLGITAIFDLRAEVEIRKYQSATPEIEGVRVTRVPVSDTDEYDPMALGALVASFATDEKDAFATSYTRILENGGPAYEKIFRHLLEKPDEPCLLHCTAGKDRTGMFAAILQLLLGASDEDIMNDYYLTTIGLQPVLPYLVARFQKEAMYRDNWQGFMNMGSAKKETMQATLAIIREKFGGAEGYIKKFTTLTDGDIAQIRKSLVVPEV